MGEIKSTLDLVLEKTMHLSLSSEEKQELAVQEAEKRLKGLLQKYQDGLLTLEELESEYGSIEKQDQLSAGQILIKEIIGRLGLLKDNGPMMVVLSKLGNLKTAGLNSVIEEFHGNYRKAAAKRSEALKKKLADQHRISGSAVVPNLAADEPWLQEADEIQSKFEERLAGIKAEMLSMV